MNLKNAVLEHAYLYYVKNEPIISDQEFDKLFQELKKQEENIPEADRITNKVACGVTSNTFKKVKHVFPMLSLDNAFSQDDFLSWVKSNELETSLELVLTPKLDGASLSLVYQDRMLIRGLRRGDGIEGDDITASVYQIANIPAILPSSVPDGLYEVRGEVMCPSFASDFAEQYKNHRNFVSGSLNLKEPTEVAKRGLRFFAHGVFSTNRLPNQYSKCMEFLESEFGIETVLSLSTILTDIGDFNINSALTTTLNNVDTARYPIDGLVAMLNDLNVFQKLGNTSHHPRGAIAIKSQADEEVTTIVEVEWQVGKSGTITPVALLEPVELNGTTVKRCTLHNMDEIVKLDVAINDTVKVTKAGFIIPKIIEVVARPVNRIKIALLACPSCGAKVEKTGAFIKCPNKNCADQLVQQLIKFCHTVKIVGLGAKTIEKLVHLKIVTSLLDLITLSISKLEIATGSETLAEKIHESITDRLNNIGFVDCLGAIGIPNVNVVSAQKLVNAGITSIFDLKDKDRILNIPGFAAIKATTISSFVINNFNSLTKLSEKLPLTHLTDKDVVIVNDQTKTNIVITGKVSVSRSQAKTTLAKYGYNLQDSVTSKTQLLVIGDKPGEDKVKKAKLLNIPIITYKGSEFSNII